MKWFGKKREESLERIERRKKREDLKIRKNMHLSKNFARRVIELENQIERPDATKDNINDLMDLYTVNIPGHLTIY